MSFYRSVEMSVSREEFLRLFAAVVPAFDDDGESIRWHEETRRGTTRLMPLPDRPMGRALLPRHRVDIVLDGCSEAEGEAFMTRFHRAFLRGGG